MDGGVVPALVPEKDTPGYEQTVRDSEMVGNLRLRFLGYYIRDKHFVLGEDMDSAAGKETEIGDIAAPGMRSCNNLALTSWISLGSVYQRSSGWFGDLARQ